MNELISIIVPVYNNEKYLDKCIESITKQTYTKLEIILVDDGSPDNCPQICDRWAEKDSRIKVIHKQNGGVSSARNSALDKATGNYISFVDSDDYLEPDAIEVLYSQLKENTCDVSIGSFLFDYTDNRQTQKQNAVSMIIENDEILKNYLLDKNIRTETPNKLYKAELFNGIRFSPDISYAEDFKINYYILKNCKKAVLCDKYTYHYLQESGNSSTTPYMTVQRAESYRISKDILNEQEYKSELYYCALWRLIVRLFALITRVCKAEDKSFMDRYFDVYRQEILNYKSEIYRGSYSKKQKIATFLLDKLPKIYIIVTKKIL